MKRVLVNSDVVIDYLRIRTGILEDLFDLQQEGEIELLVFGMTVIEVYSGLSAGRLEKEIDGLINCFEVVSLDKSLGKKAGEMRRGLGNKVQLGDLIIGATAVFFKANLATKNKKHFEQIPGIKFWKGDRILE